jgi:hypothetical protein
VKGKTKSRSAVRQLKDTQNETLAGDEEMASVLNDFFVCQCFHRGGETGKYKIRKVQNRVLKEVTIRSQRRK